MQSCLSELSCTLVNYLLLGSSSLLGGIPPQLLRGLGLQGPLGAADGAGAGDRDGPEVGAVAVLGGLVGNSAISPFKGVSNPLIHNLEGPIEPTCARFCCRHR